MSVDPKKRAWLVGLVGLFLGDYDYTTQLYRDYFINHYKDPYMFGCLFG